jgi:hypothetical protein
MVQVVSKSRRSRTFPCFARPLELACPPDTQAFHWRPRTAAGHRGHLSSNTISPFVRHWTNGRR